MSKNWIIQTPPSNSIIEELKQTLCISDVLAQILAQKGIHTYDAAKDFFRPRLDQLHDPFLLKDMDRAVTRIVQAIENKERILLFGDYDVDGTSAVAVFWNVLSQYHELLDFYIPDRYIEGYGVSTLGIDRAKEAGVNLIISLDCGIRSIDKVAYAQSLDIDFIVCDHHQPGETIPDCIVLDPMRKDCSYPYKGLSGCGVGFKLLQALQQTLHWDIELVWKQLDLVALSIGADIVPLTGENRILCFHGLARLNEEPRIGIATLVKIADKTFPLTLTDVVFIIAPRINAAGRIQSGKKSVELMISEDEKDLQEIAQSIDLDNQERRMLDAQITSEALEMIEEDTSFSTKKSTVLYHPEWHKGVVGIVASRIIESHYKPTIVLTESNGKATGSARSIKGIDIHHALTLCEDVLIQFGGHAFAAGMTLEIEQIPVFRNKFEEVIATLLSEEDKNEELIIDSEITFESIFESTERIENIPKFKRIIDQMEPFGPQQMKPVFLSKKVTILDASLLKGEHLKMKVQQGKIIFDAVGFRMAELYSLVLKGKPIDLVYTIETNTWKDKTSLQLIIKDLKISK
jgi:single-stranded-DNA-specific exonuclease